MATTLTKYNQFAELLANGAVDLNSTTIKLALVSASYTPNAEHDEYADASTYEVGPAGGVTIASPTLVRSGATTTWDAADTTFPALTATFTYGIIYASGPIFGKTNPVLAYLTFDGAPVALTGIDFTVVWAATGIATVA
jgi:hypothetical protein